MAMAGRLLPTRLGLPLKVAVESSVKHSQARERKPDNGLEAAPYRNFAGLQMAAMMPPLCCCQALLALMFITIDWPLVIRHLRRQRQRLWRGQWLALAGMLCSVPVPLLMPLMVDEVLLQQPGKALAAMNQLLPLSWQHGAVYISLMLLLTIALRAASVALGIVQGRQFAITVQADIAEGLQGATVTTQLLPELKKTEATWQGQGLIGYRIEVAGAVEESAKGSASIAAGVPVMLFITFTLLMLQLHSFSRAMLVFLTGPLGLAGVAAALILLNRPFGFVALLGVIALMGMIQRNSVILIDQIEQDRARGVPAWDAIVESAVRRLRPIVLTAAAAVLAMIPLSRSVFWGPMAVAIMGGLVVATVLTLLALPAMYAAWFRVKRPAPEVLGGV